MKIKKIYLLILIFTLLIIAIPCASNAIENPDDYRPNELQASDVARFETYAGRVAGFIQIIGTIVSIGALMVIGIKYMISSAEEKAEFKERLFPYVIGAILLFGASNLVNIVYVILKNMQ